MASSIWNPEIDVIDSELREILQSTESADQGAGYVAYDADLPYAGGTVGAALKAFTAASTTGFKSLTEFGAVGDGITLNDAVFADALADGERIYIPNPEVAYLISQPINLTKSNIKLLGESRLLTNIKINNSSLPVFVFGNNLQNIELANFRIDRSVTAVSTGVGIDCSVVSANNIFRELDIINQWHGMTLGETDTGQVINCNIFNNFGNGIKQISGAGANLVWDIRDSRIYQNEGNGIDIEGQGSAADVILGSIDNVYSIYNAGRGLSIIGQSGKRLNSMRLSGGAFSFNGNDGIYFDTYGARHRIAEVSANLQGTVTTGRSRATVPSGVGNGVVATVNNLDINIVGSVASQNSYNGMQVFANLAAITGNTCTDNGANVVAANEQRCGIKVATGRIVVQANLATNRTAESGSQQIGIHITDGVNCVIEGNNVAGNMVNSIVVAGTSTTNRITGNPGYNPSEMDTVTPGASPWTYTAGPTPEDLFVKGGTISSIVSESQTLATAALNATLYHLIPLSPNQEVTITYTAAPTVLRKKK